jgi:hypothetical protein
MGLDYYLYPFNLSTYEARVYPAYQSLTESGDAEPLLALVHECDRILAAEPLLREKLYWTQESVAEDVGVLEGTRADKEDYARAFVAPKILEVLCVPRFSDAAPQDMGRSPLVPYLYARSESIKDLFTTVRELRGEVLSLAIGEETQLFSDEDLSEFIECLERVARPPDPIVRRDYDNLFRLVELTHESSDLTLARCLL